MTQRIAVADLTNGGVSTFAELAGAVDVVYSDPPWSPGNEKWWRRHANAEPPETYDRFLDAWCAAASGCHPRHVFCEQSISEDHRSLLLAAVARCPAWELPLLEQWTVCYGSPRRPNVLLHFGHEPLAADLSGMGGERMTECVFEALSLPRGATVADPCTGLGMTSRMAHRHGLNYAGTELAAHRLERTVAWLLRHGYTETR